MTEFRGFKLVTLVLGLKNIEKDDQTKYDFYSHSKAETIINESDIAVYLNQSILQLYQTYK